jgi:tetratricopeptide (TPR) repeat protein
MYLEPSFRRKKKRRSSPIRVMILLLLIFAAIYTYTNIEQQEVEHPFATTLTPTPTRSAFSYIAEAEDLYAQGQVTQTIAVYQYALQLEPRNVQALIPLARLLTLEGQHFEAIQMAEQATHIAPENARAWAILGLAYDWRGYIPEAIEACQRAIELDSNYADGYAYLAEAYADAGRWADANQTILKALELDPRSVDAHRNHGYILELQGNYWQALDAYRSALEIHPNLPHIHVAVGKNHRALGDYRAAIESFERAAAINPSNAQVLFELGWTHLIYLGEYEQAQTYFRQATAADPQMGRAFGALAITYWARRNYEETIPNFERAIRLESAAARRRVRAFYVTIEAEADDDDGPSLEVVLKGEFAPVSLEKQDILQAVLTPSPMLAEDEDWSDVQGTVTLDTATGKYTINVSKLPRLRLGQAYVGWFEGIRTLAGKPYHTAPLPLNADRTVTVELEATWVQGPAIEYFYTLGLAYFYLDQCDRAYPLFDAALQINAEETNALEGIRLCRQIGG